MGKKLLIVVDMQYDFIDGALGTSEAEAIVDRVNKKIKQYRANEDNVIFTQDTHDKDYLNTNEGKNLPIPHCKKHTHGWRIPEDLLLSAPNNTAIIEKNTFGYANWKDFNLERYEEIEIIGLCSDICVITNALVLKTFYPETNITVDATCCAGTTPEHHFAAMAIMKSCQINIKGD